MCYNRTMNRAALALTVGCVAALLTYPNAPGDLSVPLYGARALLSGDNPYDRLYILGPHARYWPLYYPLPALLLLAPLVWLPDALVGALVMGVAVGALGYGLRGPTWTLLASYPFWVCLRYGQPWPILAVAAIYSPGLLPLSLAKPNLAAPLLLSRPLRSLWPVAIGGALILVSVGIGWLDHLASHENAIPLLMPAAPPLVLCLWRWRDRDARRMLLFACIPQRTADTLLVAPVARSWRIGLLLTAIGWLSYSLAGFDAPIGVLIVTIYLPALLTTQARPR
jgi:hypothetical protein